MLIQPRRVFVAAVLGLATVSGCQGIGQFIPDFGAKSDPLARSLEKRSQSDQSAIPTKVTEKNYAQVQMAFGDSMAKDGNFEAAQSAYEAAVRNDDTLARAYHRLAIVREKTGKGDAQEMFLRAIELDPKNAELACDYGYCCYLREDWKESQKQFQRALKLNPNMQRAHNNLGLVYARTKRPDDALKQFALAGLSPADARTNLGFIYLSEQRMPEARVELERAVAQNPAANKAREVLASMDQAVEKASAQASVPAASAGERVLAQQASLNVAPAAAQSTSPTPAVAQHNNQNMQSVAQTKHHALRLPPAPETVPTVEIAKLEAQPRPERLPAPTSTTPRVALAEKPAMQPTDEPQTNSNVPPGRKLAPVLSDYSVGSTLSKPAPKVELTEFAERRQISTVVTAPSIATEAAATAPAAQAPAQPHSDHSIRFLPMPK